MILQLTIDILNFALAIFTLVILTLILFRTKGTLDRVFKYYLMTMITLTIATLIQLDSNFSILSSHIGRIIFTSSRLLAMVFFLLGTATMYFLVTKESTEHKSEVQKNLSDKK